MDHIVEAITTFYHSQNLVAQQEAHKILLDVQKSDEGWCIAWNLLIAGTREEVQYYGAVILQSKLRSNFNVLSSENLLTIKNSLLEQCVHFCNGPKLIWNKLCTCVAIVILAMLNDEFDLNFHLESINECFNKKNVSSKNFVLEFLGILPQQFKLVSLSPSRRMVVMGCFNSYVQSLLNLTHNILSDNNERENNQNQALLCLLSWIEMGISCVDVTHQLLADIISKIRVPLLASRCFDVLVELITSPSSFRCENTIFIVLEMLVGLEQDILQAIQERDEEKTRNFALLLTSLGETHANVLISTNDQEKQKLVFHFVKLIFLFTSIQGNFPIDETASELTFSFWFALQDALLSLDVDQCLLYHKQLSDVFNNLLDALYTKCMLPDDVKYEEFNSDDTEKLRCYRIDIQDAMLYEYAMLGDKCVTIFANKLHQLLSTNGNDCRWQEYEVCFHLLKGVVEAINPEDESHIPNILGVLHAVPSHPKVATSLTLYLGALSDWLRYHPHYITTVLPYILNGLSSCHTQVSCSISLKEICLECRSLLDMTNVPAIVNVCMKTISIHSTPLKVVQRLYSVCGLVVFSLPVNEADSYLEATLHVLYTSLKDKITVVDDSVRTEHIAHSLNCYVSFFQPIEESVEKSCRIVPAFSHLLPIFQYLCEKESHNDVIMSRVSSCIESALPLGEDNKLLTCLCRFIIELSKHRLHSSFISTASKLTRLCGDCHALKDVVYDVFLVLINYALSCLQQDGKKDDTADCMENFMDYLVCVLKYFPFFVFGNLQLATSLVQCSVKLLEFQELPVIKKTCKFLAAFITESIKYDIGKQVIDLCGKNVFLQCLACIGGVSPRHTTDHFADIIAAFNRHYVSQLASWMKEIFTNQTFPTSNVSATQKEQFCKAVLRERVNKRKLKDLTREFASLCRGLVN